MTKQRNSAQLLRSLGIEHRPVWSDHIGRCSVQSLQVDRMWSLWSDDFSRSPVVRLLQARWWIFSIIILNNNMNKYIIMIINTQYNHINVRKSVGAMKQFEPASQVLPATQVRPLNHNTIYKYCNAIQLSPQEVQGPREGTK